MNLEIEAGRLLARVIAGDCGIGLVMKDDCKVPMTNGKTITMPTLRPEWDVHSAAAQRWWAALIHECYHHKGTNALDFKLLQSMNIDTTKFFGMVLNMVVDHNIEHKEYGKLAGADDWMDAFYTDSYLKVSSKFSSYPEESKEACALKALIAFDHTMRSYWSGIVNLHLEEGLSTELARNMFKTLMDEAQELYLSKRDGGQPNLEVCNTLMDLLDLEEEKDAAKSQAEGSKDSSGSGEEGEGESESSGEGSGEEEGTDGEPSEGVAEKLIEMFYDDSGRVPDEGEKGSGTNVQLTYDWDANDCSGYTMVKAVEYQPKHFKGHRSNCGVERTLSGLNYSLSDKVKNILKVMSQVKWQGGFKRGKLHRKAVAKVTTGSEVIFRQKEQKVVLDTAVTVLLDSSGSMSGRGKYLHGMLACCMLNDAMNKVGIPIEVLGFTQTFEGKASHNQHLIHTTFGKRDTARDLVESMDGVNLANNDDGAAIMWAHSRLIRHKAKRKILIVLSDGSPACEQANSFAFTKKVVEEIEKKSPVELYGIGIMDRNVERIYKNHEVITTPEQLEKALLNVVKSKILG
ncbi:cobaltochelatase CobT-related protein [Vibrio cholerae]|uniref:cobaltochelatase CobT-related protein n=1 Tax=Vibrio cholerae TaxID=666 RepID=UPI00053C296A|nr:hypothetical protein [Vibrio cholerae]